MYEIPNTKKSAVYKISCNGSLLYIGKSLNGYLKNRLLSHRLSERFSGYYKLDVDVILFDSDADASIYEIYYIAILKPPLNKDFSKKSPTLKLPVKVFKHWGHMYTFNEDDVKYVLSCEDVPDYILKDEYLQSVYSVLDREQELRDNIRKLFKS